MKPRERNAEEIVDRHLALFDSPPVQEMQQAEERILRRLRSESVGLAEQSPAKSNSVRAGGRWRGRAALAAAAAVAFVVFLQMPGIRHFSRGIDAYALVESADGGLYRVSGGQPLTAGEKIHDGEIVRTDGGVGTVLALADGSRVEIRSQSALSLERADDGVRIRLDTGGVIVTAAKQRTGHLYVQTKDMIVSVLGTVFLVNAEEAGSRVAVIQGEVRVQQGPTAKKLLPGEQVATNPLMQSHPVTEQISWSREAEAHLALLQQSAAPAASAGNAVAPKQWEFEVASLKPVSQDPRNPAAFVECKGVDGVWSLARDPELGSRGPFRDSPVPAPQGRCIGTALLRALIAIAYEIPAGRISGDEGSLWHYELEAKAENPSSATKEELRQMLQTLIINRFKLKAHRYTEETPGYVLLVGKNGVKFKETSGEEEIPRPQAQGTFVPGVPGQLLPLLIKGKFGLRTFARFLSGGPTQGLPVVDKTDLAGIYDISLTLHQVLGNPGPRGGGANIPPQDMWDPPLAKALEAQLGLRLESAGKVPVEYLVVDHVEKPSEN